ncbi:MAG: acyltransferase domain-containing protein [Alphaproteobacteria bacterium]|nr:acyltransferase domain-containing protein [Alphaproteobacteria bacterium]
MSGDGTVQENPSDGAPRPGVAIVGMAGRFPGADDVESFWRMLLEGREGVTRFSVDELEIEIDGLREGDRDYVCAKGVLSDIDMFDARFFGYLPREAEVMDPQHRVFLELCWQAMENAGCDPSRYPGAIGVYAGCYMDTYVLWNLCSDESFRARLVESIQVGSLQTELGNDKDYLATRVAYKLGLTGPAMTLQTACSTSLVAIATACQAIESYACDMALAGGITIVLPQKKGYFYKEGGMLSPDGVCRTFDENAAGTVFSNGAAVVALKRLEDALADGDRIYGVIRGCAVNNDGGDKVSYTAPSVEGQAEVIALALESAGIDPQTIGYVEAHGTATPIGDPIEISGLTSAYRRYGNDRQYCVIGSLKANLGHLDVASGAIGLIKTCLCLDRETIPPQINFTAPNPKIDFEASPFFIDVDGRPWPKGAEPRRAAVSSFGVGGTNAHVIVEEAPTPLTPGRDLDDDAIAHDGALVVLSAKTETAVEAIASAVATAFDDMPEAALGDAAWTLQTGRAQFDYRWSGYVSSMSEGADRLRRGVNAVTRVGADPDLVFAFPGQGAQYPGMARSLHDAWPAFRLAYDKALDALRRADETLAADVRRLSLGAFERDEDREEAGVALASTQIAQPAIVAYEIAVARALGAWGLAPASMVGHSIGEFAAAHIAGIFSLDDAMSLVAARGKAMAAMPAGAMIAARAAPDALGPYLGAGVGVAAINAPAATTLSGPVDSIDKALARLEADGVGAVRLRTSHAFHSTMMAPAAAKFEGSFVGVQFGMPSVNVVSTSDPKLDASVFGHSAYWREQIVRPVRFAEAIESAAQRGPCVIVEIGPGQALSAMARQSTPSDAPARVVGVSPRAASAGEGALSAIFEGLGDIWSSGVEIDWRRVRGGAGRKLPLPTYPFDRKRFWVEPTDRRTESAQMTSAGTQIGIESTAGDVEELVRRQLDVVSAQLALLRGRR